MNLIITQPLQLIVIEYLTKQPYKDVAGLIQQMQRLQPQPLNPIPAAPVDAAKNGEGEKAAEDQKAPENTAV